MAEKIVKLDPSVKKSKLDPSVKKSKLMKKMDSEQKKTGGDDFVFWREAKAIKSAKRIDALNAEFCTFRGNCGKFAVELCVKNGFLPEDKKSKAALVEELGLFTEEFLVLVEEYLKSAAELCIKKMRLGALVDKSDKQATLMAEVTTIRWQWDELLHRFAAFRKNLSASRQQDSQIENLKSGLSNVKYERGCFKVRGLRQSFRVLVEMMRGVNTFDNQLDKRLDKAMAWGKQWTDALVDLCLIKIWVGTFVEGLSVFEVLKREIAENWKMEKELKDRIVAYKRKHTRLAKKYATEVGLQPRVEGDDTIKGEGETSGVGAVVEGDETVEVKKSDGNSVVEGDEAIKEKKSGVGIVLEGEETVQEKKSEGVNLGEAAHVVEADDAIKEKNKTLKNKRKRTLGKKLFVTSPLHAMAEPIVEVDSSVRKSMLMKNIDLEQKETGGDDFVFWREANAIQSAKRIDALNAELCTFRGECGKFAVEQCLKNGMPKDKKIKAALIVELGFYTEECQALVEEYVKSAAELCIKKMRLGALVDKRNKQKTLRTEVITTKKQRNETWHTFADFRKNLFATRKQLQQDSHAHVNAEDNDLGGAPEKSPEIPRSQISSASLCKSGLRNFAFKPVVLRRESFRVLVEMMRGVNKIGKQLDKRLDNALALGKRWTDALVCLCMMKLWVGTMVERHSVYEVLKREIAENWKMEKELKDRIVAYQREHARLAQGSVTKVGDDTIKGEGETSGVGAVVEGDEAIKEQKSGVGTVLEGEETIQEKKSEGVALGEAAHVVDADEAIKKKNETLINKRKRTSGKKKNKTRKNKRRKTSG